MAFFVFFVWNIRSMGARRNRMGETECSINMLM